MGGREAKINSSQRNGVIIKRDIKSTGIKREVKRINKKLLRVQGGG